MDPEESVKADAIFWVSMKSALEHHYGKYYIFRARKFISNLIHCSSLTLVKSLKPPDKASVQIG